MHELRTSENLGMSPSRVKSENELGSLTLIPVDTVVITKLSCYLARPPSRVESLRPKAAGCGGRSRPHGSRQGSTQRAVAT